MVILEYVWSGFDRLMQIIVFSWLAIGLVIDFIKSKAYKAEPETFRNDRL